MKFLVLLAFVSSCGTFKPDTASAWDKKDRADAIEILNGIKNCEARIDFVLDSALDHGLDIDPVSCKVILEK